MMVQSSSVKRSSFSFEISLRDGKDMGRVLDRKDRMIHFFVQESLHTCVQQELLM